MAALVDGETVKVPGTLVVSGYSTTPDITKVVTPDIKLPESKSHLLVIDLGKKVKYRKIRNLFYFF